MRLLLTVLMLAQATPRPAERPATSQERKAPPRRPNYPRKMKF
jgi:hypothetical protein